MSWTEIPPTELESQDSPGHPVAPWFGKARRERREHYASRPARPLPRKRAVITMVHNEPVFLPLWLGYYSRWFAPEDIYVLDNDTTDGSTARDGFVRIPVAHDCVDEDWRVKTVQGLQHELIDRYEIVVVTDVDEIVAPLPHHGSLGAYLDRFDEEWVNCLGYELLHCRRSEPRLDPSWPILSQRHHWFANGGYDKAALTMAPVEWRTGFHGRADFQYNPDPDLRLIHLHRMDYEICLARHQLRSGRAYSQRDHEEQRSLHNLITDPEAFERWFYEDSCFDGVEIKLEEIPPAWRHVF
ncbi:MAG: glycosyltransferase family 2 protein [Solirubrobacteraceae bacterium]